MADGVETGAILNNMMAIVIDPARMATGEEPIATATERMIEWVKSATAGEGTPAVLTPGEPEQINRARLGTRLEIDPTTWGEIGKAALRIGLTADALPRAV